MKRSKFSEEQVAYALRQAESGTPVDARRRAVFAFTQAIGFQTKTWPRSTCPVTTCVQLSSTAKPSRRRHATTCPRSPLR